MKIVLVLLASVMVLVRPCSAGVTEPGVLALGDWSEPVANEHHFQLRGRLAICEYPAHRGFSGSDIALYVELQEYCDSVGLVGEVHWDAQSVHCELTDSAGKVVPGSPDGYGGFIAGPAWIKLPAFSSMRLRVGPAAGGKMDEAGFMIRGKSGETWALKPDDAKTYYLSGEFTAKPSPDYKPEDCRGVWTGTLKLPKLKLSLPALREARKDRPWESRSSRSEPSSRPAAAPLTATC